MELPESDLEILWTDDELVSAKCPICGEAIIVRLNNDNNICCGKRYQLYQHSWVKEINQYKFIDNLPKMVYNTYKEIKTSGA